jgi:hypothetical protein
VMSNRIAGSLRAWKSCAGEAVFVSSIKNGSE